MNCEPGDTRAADVSLTYGPRVSVSVKAAPTLSLSLDRIIFFGCLCSREREPPRPQGPGILRQLAENRENSREKMLHSVAAGGSFAAARKFRGNSDALVRRGNSDALVRRAIYGDEEGFVPRTRLPSLPLLPG